MENQQYPKSDTYYYHAKHDPMGPINEKAYRIITISMDTESEDDSPVIDVIYRAIYESRAYKLGRLSDRRLLHGKDKNGKAFGFLDPTEINGEIVPRFTEITDMEVINQLKKIEAQMYA